MSLCEYCPILDYAAWFLKSIFSNTPTGAIWHWMFFRCFDTIVPGNLTVIFDVLGSRFLPSIQFRITTKLFLNAFALPQLFSFAKFVTFFEVVQIQNMLFVVLFPGSALCWIQVSWSSDQARTTVGTKGLNLSLCLFIWWRYLVGGVIFIFSYDQCYPYLVSWCFLTFILLGCGGKGWLKHEPVDYGEFNKYSPFCKTYPDGLL